MDDFALGRVRAAGDRDLGKAAVEHVRDVVLRRFGLVDLVEDLFKRRAIQLDLHLAVDFLKDLLLVALIQNAKRLRIQEPVDVLAQHTHAESVVGRDEAVVVSLSDQSAHAFFHLPGSLRREGDAENVARMDARAVYEVRVAMRERFRFSGTGAGDDAHVSLRRRHRLDLLRIQFLKNVLHNNVRPSAPVRLFIPPALFAARTAFPDPNSPPR